MSSLIPAISIGRFLVRDATSANGTYGICRSCGRRVEWRRQRLLTHKTSGNCKSADSEEELRFFQSLRRQQQKHPQKQSLLSRQHQSKRQNSGLELTRADRQQLIRTNLNLNQYMQRHAHVKSYGYCRVCHQKVEWRRQRLISHKTSGNCRGANLEEVALFNELSEKKNTRTASMLETNRLANIASTSEYHELLHKSNDNTNHDQKLLPKSTFIPDDECNSLTQEGNQNRLFSSSDADSKNQADFDSTLPCNNYNARELDEQQHMMRHSKKLKHLPSTSGNDILDGKIAAFFFRTGVPFNVANCQEFRDIWKYVKPEYTPPTSRRIRSSLLETTYEALQFRFKQMLSAADHCTLVCDGWSGTSSQQLNRDSVIFIAVTANQHPFFLKSIPKCAMQHVNSHVIAKEISKVIEALGGIDKVASVVTDECVGMQQAWGILNKNYPSLFLNSCAEEVLKSMMRGILNLQQFQQTLQEVVSLTKYILSDSVEVAFDKKKIRLPVASRWYSTFYCLDQLLQIKDAVVQSMHAEHNTSSLFRTSGSNQFGQLVASTGFWQKVEQLHRILERIYQLIHTINSTTAQNLTEIYFLFDQLLTSDRAEEEALKEIFLQKWNFLHTDAMDFCMILNPKLKVGTFLKGKDRVNSMFRLQKRIERIFSSSSPESSKKCVTELDDFCEMIGHPSESMASFIDRMSPLKWWKVHGRLEYPLLATVAIRIFYASSHISSIANDRVWNAMHMMESRKLHHIGQRDCHAKMLSCFANYSLAPLFPKSNCEEKENRIIDYALQALDDEIYSDNDDFIYEI